MVQKDRRDLEKLLDKKLAGLATKEDLARLESGIRQVFEEGIIPQLDRLHARMSELTDAMERIERRLQAVIDRQDRQAEILERHEKRLADHERRLEILGTATT